MEIYKHFGLNEKFGIGYSFKHVHTDIYTTQNK